MLVIYYHNLVKEGYEMTDLRMKIAESCQKQQLIELYHAENMDSFVVGYIRDFDEKYIMFEVVDDKGRFKAFTIMALAHIEAIEIDTDYCKLITQYIAIQRDSNCYNALALSYPQFAKAKGETMMEKALHKLAAEQAIGLVGISENDVWYAAKPIIIDKGIMLLIIEPEDLSLKMHLRVTAEELHFLEYTGVDAYLANELIKRSGEIL